MYGFDGSKKAVFYLLSFPFLLIYGTHLISPLDSNTSSANSLGAVSAPACNVLLNTEFDAGLTNWSNATQSGNTVTFSADNTSQLSGINSARVDITTATGTPWHIQFYQQPVALTIGKEYSFSFSAKASKARTMEIIVQESSSPYTLYHYQAINLTTTATDFGPFTFTATTTDPSASFMFNLAGDDGTVYLDDVAFCDDIDLDNDLICNRDDLDDDNDGILDTLEGCICEVFDISSLDGNVFTVNDFNTPLLNLSGAIIQLEDPLTFGGTATLDEFSVNDNHETGSYGIQMGVNSTGTTNYLQANYTFSQPVCDFNARLLDIDVTDALVIYGFLDGVEVLYSVKTQGTCVAYDNANTFSSSCLANSSPANGNVNDHAIEIQFNACIDSLTLRTYENGANTGGSFTFVISPDPTCSYLDTDGDGLADCWDIDSDGDGCVDAVEGAGTFTPDSIDINAMLLGTVDANGVPDMAGAAGQTIGDSRNASVLSASCIESCSNGMDDDGDGYSDCFDPDCPCYATIACDGRLYQTIAIAGDFWLYEIQTNPVSLTPIFNLTSAGVVGNINNAYYNSGDGFIYFMNTGAPYGLYRVNAVNDVELVGTVSGAPSGEVINAAGNDNNGNYYFRVPSTGDFYLLDEATLTLSLVCDFPSSSWPQTNIGDFAFNPIDGKFYGVRDDTDMLISIDLNTCNQDTITLDSVVTGALGAFYVSADGTGYGYGNSTGDLYEIDLVNGGIALIGTGSTTSNTDGCSCSTVLITKTTDVDTMCIADTLTYTFTVFNHSGSVLSNLTFTDTLPDGFVFVSDPYNISGITFTGSTATIGQDTIELAIATVATGVNNTFDMDIVIENTATMGDYVNQARLFGLPAFLPSFIFSDDPGTIDVQDPTRVVVESCAEICGNGFDDDGDGNADNLDSDCCNAQAPSLAK